LHCCDTKECNIIGSVGLVTCEQLIDGQISVSSGGMYMYTNWVFLEAVCFPANVNSTVSFHLMAQSDWDHMLVLYYNQTGWDHLTSNVTVKTDACWKAVSYAENFDPEAMMALSPVPKAYQVQFDDERMWLQEDLPLSFTTERKLYFVVASCYDDFERVDMDFWQHNVLSCGGTTGLSQTDKIVVGVVVGVGGGAMLLLALIVLVRLHFPNAMRSAKGGGGNNKGAMPLDDGGAEPHPPASSTGGPGETPEGNNPPAQLAGQGTVVVGMPAEPPAASPEPAAAASS